MEKEGLQNKKKTREKKKKRKKARLKKIAAYKQPSNRVFRWLYNMLTINSPSKVPELSSVPKLNLDSSSSVGE